MNRSHSHAPMFVLLGTALLLWGNPELSQAQSRPAPWNAQWIGYPGSDGMSYEVLFFRRSVDLATVPESFPVHVSADNRYRLYVNGESVAKGPARGDLDHWRYETVDLAPHLREGENLVAAVVWNYAELRPVAQISLRTGFVLQGASDAAEVLNTGTDWEVLRSEAHAPIPVNRAELDYTYIVVGPGEHVDGRRYPWDWTDPESDDDRRWVEAGTVGRAYPRGSAPYGAAVDWQLIPREIPAMEERPVRFSRIARVEEAPSPFATSEGFLRGEEDLVVPPRSHLVLLLDQAELTTAYPVLRTSAGTGARIELVYAEALFQADGDKGNRNVLDGKTIRGIRDGFVLDGGTDRMYTTLWWRTWRYVQLSIQTADEEVRLHDIHGLFTAYPFEERGGFAADDPDIADIWRVGWRTARLCAGETYFDCPYYEQIQYVGDTRIQALISLYVSGDDRLMAKAIQDFDYSRVASGLTASRHPVYEAQYIPPYSLFWVVMIYDYWMHRDDPDFVGDKLTAIRGVLDWYERHVDNSGMLGPMPWWNFVDWAYENSGVPPGADDGNSTVISLQYVYALQMASEIAQAFDRTDEAEEYTRRATSILDAVQRHAWDPRRNFYAETPHRTDFTEHTNAMAVLVDLVPSNRQADFVRRIFASNDLLEAGFYYRFYLHRALQKAGLGDMYVDQLKPWRDMLADGLTTFAENPGRTRSDCHAWSAAPNYDFLSLVAGIGPAAPGYSRVRIDPSLGPLSRIDATAMHPAGEIRVVLQREGRSGVTGQITLPAGVSGTFVWNGRSRDLTGGTQEVRF